MEIHHPIALGKDKTEGAGRYKDPAGAQEDDSQHSQKFTGQEIVSTGEGSKKAGRNHRDSLAPNKHRLNLNLMEERGTHAKYLRN